MSSKTAMSCFLGSVSNFFNYRRLILYSLLLIVCGLFFLTIKKSALPTDVQIYQIHTPAFFKERNFRTFNDFSRNEIKKITSYGFNVIWMTGVWQPSEASHQHNLDQEDPQNPGRIANIYSIPGYQVNQQWGGGKAFRRFVARARSEGVRVLVDLIPNHHSMDSPLLETHPDWFFYQTQAPTKEEECFFYPKKMPHGETYWFRFAGDNHPWTDMIAFNYLNPEVWRYLKESMLKLADLTQGGGMRIDVLGFFEPEKYRQKYFPELDSKEYFFRLEKISRDVFGKPLDSKKNLFKFLFEEIRQRYPEIIFLGEIYDHHAFWKESGANLVYAKFVYDKLLAPPAEAAWFLRNKFFTAQGGFPEEGSFFNNVYFLENHDENRRILEKLLVPLGKKQVDSDVIGYANLLAAAIATLPGSPMVYQGQEEGRVFPGPYAYWVGEKREKANPEVEQFYRRVFKLTADPVFRRGSWSWLQALDKSEDKDILAFSRTYERKTAVVVLNFSGKERRVRVDAFETPLHGVFSKQMQAWEAFIQVFEETPKN